MATSILRAPQPMALASEVEYQLEKNGQPIGLYDIKHAGQEQGLWVGYGAWKPLPSAKRAAAKPIVDDGFNPDDDKPVLHHKHSDASSQPGSDSGSASDSGSSGEAPDPDRPTLHKKSGTGDSSASTTAPAGPTAVQNDPQSSRHRRKAAILTGLCSIKAPGPPPIRATESISAAPILTGRSFSTANPPAMALRFCPPRWVFLRTCSRQWQCPMPRRALNIPGASTGPIPVTKTR